MAPKMNPTILHGGACEEKGCFQSVGRMDETHYFGKTKEGKQQKYDNIGILAKLMKKPCPI